MAKVSPSPWSTHSQELLRRAVDDERFCELVRRRGIATSQLRRWLAIGEVPATFRPQMRGALEDWAHQG